MGLLGEIFSLGPDLQTALEQVGGSLLMAKDTIDEYIHMFPEDLRKELEELRESIIAVVAIIDEYYTKVMEEKEKYR